jgi:HlyD family secretion protein
VEGETAGHLAQRAQAKGALGEAETEIQQIENDFREQVASELREVTSAIRELKEEQTALLDKLNRVDIRAPASGIVHSLNMHTVGGVIAPTEPIMQIIPHEDRLIIEAQVEPHHIDQLYVGQPATLRFPAFNQRTTPELDGHVINISADRLEDQMSGLAYYRAIIEIPKDQVARLNGLALLPGMPVEGFIKTDERTVLSYFVKPLSDQLQRAFREE